MAMRSCTPLTFADRMMRSRGRPELHGTRRALERRGDHGFAHDLLRRQWRGARVVLVHHAREQVLVEAAPVHADAHGLLVLAGELDHLGELRIALAAAADIAGVDAVLRQRLRASRMFAQQLVTVEVEVADDGHADAELREAVADRRDRGGRRGFVHGDAHQLGAGARQRLDLLRGAFDVGRVRVGHRLDDDGRGPTDGHATDVNGDGLAARMAHLSTHFTDFISPASPAGAWSATPSSAIARLSTARCRCSRCAGPGVGGPCRPP